MMLDMESAGTAVPTAAVLATETPQKSRKASKPGSASRPPLTPRSGARLPVPPPPPPPEGDKENVRPAGRAPQLPLSPMRAHKASPPPHGKVPLDSVRLAAGTPPPRRGPPPAERQSRSTSAKKAKPPHAADLCRPTAADGVGTPVAAALEATRGWSVAASPAPADGAAAGAAEALRLRVAALEQRLAEMSAAAQGGASRIRQQAAALRESERRREADLSELRAARRELDLLRALPPSAAPCGADGLCGGGGGGGVELSRHLAGLAAALEPTHAEAAAALAVAAAALGEAERREEATAAGMRELAALGRVEAGALARCREALVSAEAAAAAAAAAAPSTPLRLHYRPTTPLRV
jgi:hypothetical protein